MTVVFSSLSSMGALDLEEVKDVFSRQDGAYRVLEQSVREYVSESDERLGQALKENESLQAKITQLEILLKGRQGALVAKERECEKLRLSISSVEDKKSKPQLALCPRIAHTAIESENNDLISDTNKWLSTYVGIARTDITPPPQIQEPVRLSTSSIVIGERSPPATVFRRENIRSPDSSLSPRRIVQSSLRRLTRESFTSVRSSRTVRSLSDHDSSSDESLNELVSNAMRLSQASFRSSASSRASMESARSSFPKRWK